MTSDNRSGLASHDVAATAERWLDQGRPVALATVLETWGSGPRPVGSQLVIDGDGNFEGSVSGGCVEGAVVIEAIEVIGTGVARTLEFGVADETAWRVGLACGGRVRIYVETVDPAYRRGLQVLNQARIARQAAVTVTDLASGQARIELEAARAADPMASAIRQALRSGRSETVHETPGDAGTFINVFLPPPRLVIVGAVHISQALGPMARLAGLDVTIVDPRTAFASADRFPDGVLVVEWPEDALRRHPLDPFTALAAVTHDPKIDDFALQAALEAGCFYVGALGSRKTHAKRLERLGLAGVAADDTARIRAPIGLAIGAQSPAEIAVSILAEVIGALRQRKIPDGVDVDDSLARSYGRGSG